MTLENINALLRSMPPEIMFIIRAANLVGIHNALLGGIIIYKYIKVQQEIDYLNLQNIQC